MLLQDKPRGRESASGSVSPGRSHIGRGIQARYGTRFPWGTLAVNVFACLLLGLVAGTAAASGPPAVQALIGTGLCAALSTFSTFSYQTLRFTEEGFGFFAIVNVLANVLAGLAAARGGLALAQAIWT
jgi:CrcB protein